MVTSSCFAPIVVVAAPLVWPAATQIRAQQATPGEPQAPARKAAGPLEASGSIRGTEIELADGETAGKVDVALPRAGVIAGRIVDDPGEPAAYVRVTAMRSRCR